MVRLCGVDLGASEVKITLCDADGAALHRARAASRGHLLAALLEAAAGIPEELRYGSVRVAVTGSGRCLLEGVAECRSVNEVLATAVAVGHAFPEARTVIDLGGQFSKWILLGRSGEQTTIIDFSTNGLCAAGAGAFLEQQASRLGLTVDQLGRMATAAPRGATIAGRCSVFAKSDMIHLQQKGTPLEEIAFGLCQALARTFIGTVVQGRRIEAPVVLAGGGASNGGLVRAFREQLGLSDGSVLAPEDAAFFGALGAAAMAKEAPVTELSLFLDTARQRSQAVAEDAAIKALPALAPASPKTAESPARTTGSMEGWLGLDVGSVSTNLVLLSPDFQVLDDVYLPTQGRPIEALNQGLLQIREHFGERLRVLGVGATGSGRHLAAKAVGADVTHNEITAQMVSSLHFFPGVETIFEIGGQDSKYISVGDGRLAGFEMNKICAGGTGSFLEEQAERLGIRIVGEFSELALRAARPCDLGSRCTVFMDSELVRAQEQGAPIEDLCAGLAYSVARNYLEKVVAGRTIGDSIVFQGGTASNRAVVAAFRQLLGRPLHVHPHNRVSGAIGAALLASRGQMGQSQFLGWASCGESKLRSFECQRCENRCQVNRIQLGPRTVHFGDVCDRYSERDREERDIRRPFPELFAQRRRLLESFLTTEVGPVDRPRLGLLRASLNLEFLPFWAAFLRELGYQPVIYEPGTPGLLSHNLPSLPAEVCLPIKASAAQAKALLADGVDKLFVPALLECPRREETDPSDTCFYTQELPEMLRVAFPERVIAAQFAMRDGVLGLVEPVLALAGALDRPLNEVRTAFVHARAVQARFAEARKGLGQTALLASFDRAVVVLGHPYNLHDPSLNLSLARHLERLGLPAIPCDLLPLDEVRLDPRWQTVPWHYNREQLRAIELIHRDRRLFPILISSYGCGPDGFTSKHLEELLAGRPRLMLEFDEHRGEAGLVTRLEAFADEIGEHIRQDGARTPPLPVTPGRHPIPSGRRFFVPHFSEHAGIYAAVLRSAGFAAEVLPAPDAQTTRLGEQYSSGRECHPYTVLAGELIQLVRDRPIGGGDVFVFPNCSTPCLLRQYGDALRILLHRHNLPKIEVWDAVASQIGRLVGPAGLLRLYEGVLATDILFTLATRLHPYAKRAVELEEVRKQGLGKLALGIVEKRGLAAILEETAGDLCSVPRTGPPGTLPVVGVTGDLYTRMNPVGNAGLFRRLEQLGCEVWPSPFFAVTDFGATLEAQKKVGQGHLMSAAAEALTRLLTSEERRRLTQRLSPEVCALAVEPPTEELIRLAQPYVGPRTNFAIVLTVAKIADFLRRGAAGVVSAAGMNCAVGTVTGSLIPALRARFGDAPIISLVYGGAEGSAQRIRLETFVERVQAHWHRPAA